MFFSQIRPGHRSDVGILSLEGQGSVDWVLDGDAHESNIDLSPDGRWVAYSSDESGQVEIWVRPFPIVGETRWQISRGGGRTPKWGPDSREVFYQTADPGAPTIDAPLALVAGSTLMVVMNESDQTFSPGSPVPLFDGPYLVGIGSWSTPYDVSADGQRFLMIKEDPAPVAATDQLAVVAVLNWVDELRRLLPND